MLYQHRCSCGHRSGAIAVLPQVEVDLIPLPRRCVAEVAKVA